MLDKSIPYRNIIMRWDGEATPSIPFTPGGTIVTYQEGDVDDWVRIQMEAGEFLDVGWKKAADYFCGKYGPREDEMKKRCLFFVDESGEKVGTCTAWLEEDEEKTPSVHWLAVSEKAQGKGIGWRLICETLKIFEKNQEFPVYLHTQPWSHRAVSLYLRAGFRFCRRDTFGGYKNQNEAAVNILKKYIEIPTGVWTA